MREKLHLFQINQQEMMILKWD